MKPLASQFADWMDSYWHKDETIPSAKIAGLQGLLDTKAEAATVTQLNEALGDVQTDIETLFEAKQDVLDFDDAPTEDSSNPVKSSGVKTALDGKAEASHTHTKSAVGLGNVDNTSDANKPISVATQTALDAKANATNVLEINSSNYESYVKKVGTEQRCTIYNIPGNVNVIAINDSRVVSAGIIRFVGATGFPNGWIIKVLNTTGSSGTIATFQAESTTHSDTEGTIQGYGGIGIDSASWGKFRFIEFVYWNERWYSPVYDYDVI